MYDATRGAGFGREVKRRCLIGAYALSAGYYDAYYGQAQRVRTLIRRDFDRVFENCDLLLTPTAPTIAFPFGARTDGPAGDVRLRPVHAARQPLRDARAVDPVRAQRGPAGRAAAARAGVLARARCSPPGTRSSVRFAFEAVPARAGRDDRMSAPQGWEAVIGLEIHVQLGTRTKMFCRCENVPGGEPNTRICPVCTAQPGALPVANGAAVEKAILVGLALGSRIADRSLFYRKNYFYPDSPKAYQISQYDEPLCVGGSLTLPTADGDEVVQFVRVHLEEDAAKTIHAGGGGGRLAGSTGVGGRLQPLRDPADRDGHRALPAHDPAAAGRFGRALKATIEALGVSDCDMEKGSLRMDANVSVRREGETDLRTKTELKNMNSFSYLERGIAREVDRQVAVYEAGGEVVSHTLHYDPSSDELTELRSKEEVADYRYFPEPDLVPMAPSPELISSLMASMPELPAARIRRFTDEHELPFRQAADLTASPALASYFEQVAEAAGDSRAAANWTLNEVARHLNEHGLDAADAPVAPRALAALIGLVDEGVVGSAAAREVFLALAAGEGDDPRAIVEERGLGQIADTGALAALVDEVIAANPAQAEQYRDGKDALAGFFVGQVMKRSGGRAEPRAVQELLRARLRG